MYSQNINRQKKNPWVVHMYIPNILRSLIKRTMGSPRLWREKSPTLSTIRKKKHRNKKNNSTNRKSNQKKAKRRGA